MDGATYDRVAAKYAALVPTDLDAATSVIGIATRALLSGLDGVGGLRVLDLGCGEGHVARRVQAAGGVVVGVDVSEALLQLARERSHGIEFLCSDAQTLEPLPSRDFDVVYSNLALMDIPDLGATYAAVARVLRPGGRFVYTLVHPCFCTPGSDVLPDADGRFAAGIVRRYTEEGFWRSGISGTLRNLVGAHHRMLSTYINLLLASGFVLGRLAEPTISDRDGLSLTAQGSVQLPPVLLVEARRVCS